MHSFYLLVLLLSCCLFSIKTCCTLDPFSLLHRAYLHLGKNPTWYHSWWAHLYHVPACVFVIIICRCICLYAHIWMHVCAYKCLCCMWYRQKHEHWCVCVIFKMICIPLCVCISKLACVCVCVHWFTCLNISAACVPRYSSSALLAVV